MLRRILTLIDESGNDVAKRVAHEFGVSRQTANTYLKELLSKKQISAEGKTKARFYSLANTQREVKSYNCEGLEEDRVWQEVFAPVVADLPENVRDIWRYGVTEMVNNAVDHSGSPGVIVTVEQNALYTKGWVIDEGEGIFNKIQRELGLYDPRQAILELAKGKLTTDPEHHTGEGIFFTSKVFDKFIIVSGTLGFIHVDGDQDWFLENSSDEQGTNVSMRLSNDSERILKNVFDEFAPPEEFSFAKTIVPVRLAQYEGEKLVSRSQAKRLYQRFERFSNVVLDFEGVSEIGQAFADELFRVFVLEHPTVELIPVKTTEAVSQMIKRAQARAAE
ncbi:ArsR family transcriptional regulator [Desulfocarbo indianensis]|nr:ArsR family transcriptional regulator [Desulfocarbo indianensis]